MMKVKLTKVTGLNISPDFKKQIKKIWKFCWKYEERNGLFLSFLCFCKSIAKTNEY